MTQASRGRLRIVHYVAELRWSIGGPVRAALDWCGAFAARGHEVVLITYDAIDAPPTWTGGAGMPRVVAVPPPGRFQRLGAHAMALAEKAIAGADVLHLHAPWTVSNLQLARVARRRGIRYVLTVHGMLDDWCMAQRGLKKRLYLAIAGRRLLDGAAAVHFTASAESEQARKWFNNPNVVVLPLLFDLSEFSQLPGPEPARAAFDALRAAEPKVFFLSRLHPKKGLDLLLQSVALLRDKGVRLRLIVAGDGESRHELMYRDLAQRLALDEVVSFVGLVKGELKLSVYQAADLFVLPTSQENFGFVLPEAMACGTPVMTTRGVDIWQDLQQGGAVIVDRDAARIAQKIEQLLADATLRKEISRLGREWVLEHLDPGRIVEAYERLYAGIPG